MTPMPLVSAEKYAQLIRKAKKRARWGLNEKIYINSGSGNTVYKYQA